MSSPDPDALLAQRTAARKRLNRFWLGCLAAAAISLMMMYQWLLTQWPQQELGGWLLIAALGLFYELRILKQTLPLMHAPGESTLVQRLPLETVLTLCMGLFFALAAGFLMLPATPHGLDWLPAALMILGLIADIGSDRIRGRHQPLIGDLHLRREFRALGLLVGTAIAIHLGKLAPWFLAIGIMDYLELFTGSWLQRKRKPISQPPSPQVRRFFQTLYLAAIGMILWPIIPQDFALIVGLLFGLPYFAVALRDWFILTGFLNPDEGLYHQLVEAYRRALQGWLALTIRLLGAMATATIAADLLLHLNAYASRFHLTVAPILLSLAMLVTLPMLLMGIRVRWAAGLAFIATSIVLLVMGWNLVIFIALLLLGFTILLSQEQWLTAPENTSREAPPEDI